MTRITNADQVLLLLRGHLERAERSRRKGASQKAEKRTTAKQTPLERVHNIAHNEALSRDEIERALISGLLTEEFGGAAANDAKFQLVVTEVLKAIRQEPVGQALLARAVSELVEERK